MQVGDEAKTRGRINNVPVAAAASVLTRLQFPTDTQKKQFEGGRQKVRKQGSKRRRRNGRGTLRRRGGKRDEGHSGASGPTTAQRLQR